MRRLGWALGVAAVLAGLLPALEQHLLREVHRGLADGEAVRAADVIAVFGGGGGDRVRLGMDLLERGYAPEILFVGTGPEMEYAHSLSKRSPAYSPRRTRFLPQPVTSTAEGAGELVRWARSNRSRRVLVVSDGWHLTRIRTLLSAWQDLGFEPVLVPVWRTAEEAAVRNRWTLVRELAALGYLGLRGALAGPPGAATLD